MTGLDIIYYGSIIWGAGFIGGLGVLLYDYRGYGRDVKLGEFLKDMLLTFILWPCITHHIIIYSLRPLFNLVNIDLSKLKNIIIVKGSKK